MSALSLQILESVETLPLDMQQEALDFVEFLKTRQQGRMLPDETPNGSKLAALMMEIAQRGTAFCEMHDPVAWQREIRQDRVLFGRGD